MQSTGKTVPGTVTISSKVVDLSCAEYDLSTYECKKCSYSFHPKIVDSKVKCILNDPLCKAYNDDFTCSDCFGGYYPSNGQCYRTSSNQETDPYCKEPKDNNCTECFKGYYVNLNTGRCKVANARCKSSDKYDRCTSCFQGYTVSEGDCVDLH